ncbi:MAG: LemA family protein [Flavobacteriaceae bacterium]|jgi:LemA protein|nr:LemA family protein [Flavobacteriaceae bacterium]
MKKALPFIIAAVVLVGAYFIMSMNYQNSALTFKQKVDKSWADIEGAYQRRSDLIPNLVEVAKKAADFEKSTLEAVTNARAKATSINIDPSNMTAEQLTNFQQAQSGVSSALGRLMVTMEKYPELKATEQFTKLQDELASTENQIFTQRTRFNETVEAYNTYILKVPNKFFLSDYKEKPYFKAEAGTEKAPKVQF